MKWFEVLNLSGFSNSESKIKKWSTSKLGYSLNILTKFSHFVRDDNQTTTADWNVHTSA